MFMAVSFSLPHTNKFHCGYSLVVTLKQNLVNGIYTILVKCKFSQNTLITIYFMATILNFMFQTSIR